MNFIILLGGVFFAFAIALVRIYKGLHDSAHGGTLDENCQFLLDTGGEDGGIGPTVVALLEIMLGAGPDLSTCLHASAQSVTAPLIMDGFRTMVVLLALNMLIAQMATTYDKIRERLAANYSTAVWIELTRPLAAFSPA